MSRLLVLGIGNLLMGDEGVGVHAVRVLEQELASTAAQSAGSLTVVDGGTGGFHLLSYLTDYGPVILIDATMDGQPAGTVSVLEPRYASDFPRALTAHDIGLRDLIEAAVLSGPLPKIWLITVSIAEVQSMQTTMTPPVEAAIPEVIARVRQLLYRGGDPLWGAPVPESRLVLRYRQEPGTWDSNRFHNRCGVGPKAG